MAAINVMYQVSLQQFLALFDYSIANSAPAPLASKRIVNIIDYLNFHVTCYMQRGLFERHKTIWTLMLAMRIQTSRASSRPRSRRCCSPAAARSTPTPRSPSRSPGCPTTRGSTSSSSRARCRVFRDLPDAITRNDTMWKHWYDEDAPESARIPDFEDRIEVYFDKLLLVRSLREDRALLCVAEYVAETLGKRYIEGRPLDFKALTEEADKFTPMIFLLSRAPTRRARSTSSRARRRSRCAPSRWARGRSPPRASSCSRA